MSRLEFVAQRSAVLTQACSLRAASPEQASNQAKSDSHIEKERTRKLRLEHYRLKKQLREKTRDVAMLIRAWQIKMSEIRLVKKIGSGAFGDVWDALWHEKMQVAVKFVKGTAVSTPQGSNSRASSQGNSSLASSSTSSSKFLFDKKEIKFLMRTWFDHIS